MAKVKFCRPFLNYFCSVFLWSKKICLVCLSFFSVCCKTPSLSKCYKPLYSSSISFKSTVHGSIRDLVRGGESSISCSADSLSKAESSTTCWVIQQFESTTKVLSYVSLIVISEYYRNQKKWAQVVQNTSRSVLLINHQPPIVEVKSIIDYLFFIPSFIIDELCLLQREVVKEREGASCNH